MKLRIASFGKLFMLVLIVNGIVFIGVSMSVSNDLDAAVKNLDAFEAQSSKGFNTLISLDRNLGYGGMIHQFKNYLLRGDEESRLEAIKAINDINLILKGYSKLTSLKEREASKAIADVVEQYSNNLTVIAEMKKQGASLKEIDAVVIVSDKKAYEGLSVLNHSIQQKIQNEASNLEGVFGKIQVATKQQLYLVIFALFIFISGCVYLIWYRVTKPLGILSNAMERLAAGDFQAHIPGVFAKDEIGNMAHLLHLYKKKSIENFKAERQIKATHKRYADILEIASDAIISINSRHEIIIFNHGAEIGFGYEASEVMGKNVNILIPEDFHDAHGEEVDKFSKSDEKNRLMTDRPTVAGKKKDGGTFLGEGTISKIEENGEIFFTIILRDVTERIEREEELKQAMFDAEFANRSKSAFLANMSHELRTPLNAIIGFSSLLMEADTIHLNEDKQREYSKDIHESGQHLLGLISDLLDLSKIESGKADLNEQQVSPLNIIQGSINYIKVRANENDIRVIVEDVAEGIEIHADVRMLKQMLVNLLSNAVKFTLKGGEIRVITALCEGGNYSIKVRDSGIGIAEEHLDDIISPFWQVDSKHERTNEGTGLGLPLVKALIELHGGSMNVQSQIGVGTTVELIIPYERVAKEVLLQSNVI